MAIRPTCDACEMELLDFGAILLGPPNKKGAVMKFHVCKDCYASLLKEMRKNKKIRRDIRAKK